MIKEQNKIDLKIKDLNSLVNFIAQFKSIDIYLLIEFIGDKIVAKTYNPTETVAKMSEMKIDDVFEPMQEIPNDFKIGIFNIDKFIKSVNLIKENYENSILTVFYTKEKDGSNFSLKMELKNNVLNKTILSASKNLFKSLSSQQSDVAFDISGAYFKILFDRDSLSQLMQLTSLESSNKFNIKLYKNDLFFEGKEFSLKYNQEVDILRNENYTFSLEKNIFKYLDKENYEMYGKENTLILISKETQTKIALALLDDSNFSDLEE